MTMESVKIANTTQPMQIVQKDEENVTKKLSNLIHPLGTNSAGGNKQVGQPNHYLNSDPTWEKNPIKYT